MLPAEKLALCAWHANALPRLWWRFALIAPLTLALTGLLLRSTAEDPHANLVESRKAVLALAPTPPPDAANAALDYEKAFKLYATKFQGKSSDDPTTNLNRESAYFERPDVLAYLQAAPAPIRV